MREISEALAFKIKNLPTSPGCYLMKHEGKIIYVGKAINLKSRVTQYFRDSRQHTAKVRAMVEHIDDFEIVLVDSEMEAFALECNLIKKHLPYYNIKLKDDKHYPYIRIDFTEPFPHPELARRQEKDGAKYFGPYRGATVVREVLEVVRSVFPIRSCSKNLIPNKRLRPCVYHQIGQCMAPCAGLITKEIYAQQLKGVTEFLSGKYAPVIEQLKEKMKKASLEMNYEHAALYRDRIRAIEALMEHQNAISTSPNDRDVIAALPFEADAVVVALFIRSGRMLGSETFTLEGAGDEEAGEVLTQFILQYYDEEKRPPSELLLSAQPPEQGVIEELLTELHGHRVYLHTPQRGDKRKLVQMAEKNVRDTIDKLQKRKLNAYERTIGAAKELQEVLGLENYPRRIEGFDISNTQGAQSVASQVVMIDGTCRHDQYRIYRIKTVQGANDFLSMHEVITRRLSHGLRERHERLEQGEDAAGGKFADLPDLILIDGGRGQLNYALDAMHQLGLNIPMFGLAERIDEIVLPDQEDTIYLDRHSNALHMIQRLRDEAHRFAITHHRKLRGKASIASRLDNVPGIGAKRKAIILKAFPTLAALQAASLAQLASTPGIPHPTAEAVYNMLHGETSVSSDPS